MTLLAGAATFKASLDNKKTNIPAVIVKSSGEADDIMFLLQLAGLDDSPGAIAIGTAIVRLVDVHGVARKHIAESLDKSPQWLNGMEALIRKLNHNVQDMVTEGLVSARTAQEIARLPDEVQTPFAISVGNEFLSKENVKCLVNRYLDEDTCTDERIRIINTPKQALPNDWNSRGRRSIDCSDSARLSRAMARCLDDVDCLSNLLGKLDVDKVSVRMSDVVAMSDKLAALCCQIKGIFHPGEKMEKNGN